MFETLGRVCVTSVCMSPQRGLWKSVTHEREGLCDMQGGVCGLPAEWAGSGYEP